MYDQEWHSNHRRGRITNEVGVDEHQEVLLNNQDVNKYRYFIHDSLVTIASDVRNQVTIITVVVDNEIS